MPPTADKAIQFTVSPSGGGGNTFAVRRAQPGVIRWFSFDTAADLGGVYGDNYGITPGVMTSPVIDMTVSAEPGGGSLRFDIPSGAASDPAGSWFTNFSADLNTQFEGGSQFFVQWRQRFNSALLTTIWPGQGGTKQMIVGIGDRPGVLAASCTANDVVVQTYYQSKAPIVYNSCTGCSTSSLGHGPYVGMYETVGGGSDFKLQNQIPSPFCLYSTEAAAPCFKWVANEWQTFQLGIVIGPRVGDEFTQCRTRFWCQRPGQAAQLVVDWAPGVPGYFNLCAGGSADKYGKLWLLPYMTDAVPQAHALCQTWYDDVIISTQQIMHP